MRNKSKSIADAAIELCRERSVNQVWYGNPELCQDIYQRSGRTTAKHPLNQIAAVVSALARSPKWKLAGHIKHLGRNYPVYKINVGDDFWKLELPD